MGSNVLSNRYEFDFKRIQFKDSYHIEYCITDACDRSCACCSHLAPLAKSPNFVTVENFAKHAEILRGAIADAHAFWLTGGEPTLHPQFMRLLGIARNVFNNCFVGVYSNGNFLKKYENDVGFWEFVRQNGVVWAMTSYGGSKEYIDGVFTKNGCLNNLAYVHSGELFYNLTNYSCNQPVSMEKYNKCGWERSKINVRNGKIFNCPSAEFVDLFNNYFKLNVKLCKNDFLEINGQLTAEMIKNFKGPVPFCGNCDLTQRYKKIFKNSPSKREIGEWSTFNQEIE